MNFVQWIAPGQCDFYFLSVIQAANIVKYAKKNSIAHKLRNSKAKWKVIFVKYPASFI